MKIKFEITLDLNVMDEVDYTFNQIEKTCGHGSCTVSGEHGEDMDDIRTKLTDKDHEALKYWINWGGVLWTESSTIYPYNVQVMSTDDNGVIQDMYDSRADEYRDMDIEEYCLMLSEKALTHMGIDPDRYITWR